MKALLKDALKDVPWLVLGFILAKFVSQALSQYTPVKFAAADPVKQ